MKLYLKNDRSSFAPKFKVPFIKSSPNIRKPWKSWAENSTKVANQMQHPKWCSVFWTTSRRRKWTRWSPVKHARVTKQMRQVKVLNTETQPKSFKSHWGRWDIRLLILLRNRCRYKMTFSSSPCYIEKVYVCNKSRK